jgi:hypothetical protein
VATIRTTGTVRGRAVAEPILFDARIEELLREVAADPKSRLLRVPRPAQLGAVLGRRPSVGVATAGLGAAERELVALHRGELAYLLRKLAVVRLFESPAAATSRVRTYFSGGPRLATDRGEWVDATRTKLEGLSDDGPVDPGRELLERCVRAPESMNSLDVTAIAAAANMLDPTDQARIYAANWRGNELQRRGEAFEVLVSVIEGPGSPENTSIAAANIGRLESMFGDSRSACRWYRRSTESSFSTTTAALSWLTTALDCGDVVEAQAASERIDHPLNGHDSAIQEFVALLKAQRSARVLEPAARSRLLAARLSDSANPTLLVILNAYLKL